MTFASFAEPKVDALIDRFARSTGITLVVGAGASMEAGLPSWDELVRRVLARAAEHRRLFDGDDDGAARAALAMWIEETVRRESVLGAAAIAEVLSDGNLREWLPTALVGDRYEHLPGPIALAIARLRAVVGGALGIVTTNYDDLLEIALRESEDVQAPVFAAVDPPQERSGEIEVVHLHGYVGRDGTRGDIVLSEESYHVMQLDRPWQQTLMTERLESTDVLFVGTSLNDPNLVRYLFDARGNRRHAAVFVRQGESPLPARVREARELSVHRRWDNVRVDVVFVDDYADVAQVLHEIGRKRADPRGYVPLQQRCRARLDRLWTNFGLRGGSTFDMRQALLEGLLRAALDEAVEHARRFGTRFESERLGLALWLADPNGRRLVRCGKSYGRYESPAEIQRVDLLAADDWVAVAAYRGGTVTAEAPTSSDSPWAFIRGLPITVESPEGRLPLGALTLTTDRPRETTDLERMSGPVQASFHKILVAAGAELLTP